MTTSLINESGRVLAAIDVSLYAASVAETAGWAATRLGAPLKLLHMLERDGTAARRDLSGSLSLGTQETLLAELASLDEQRAKLSQDHGRVLLENLRDRIATTHGVQAEIRQRHGTLVENLLELEDGVRLFVLGKRGEHADFAKGHLGSNLERVLRAVHRPVLVCARAYRPINRFLIAFDGSATTRKCVEMVATSPLLKQAECSLLMVGDGDSAQQAQRDWALARLTAAGFQPHAAIVSGSPDAVIAKQVESERIDLLVMGAWGHSRIRTMILGSTTTQVLRTCLIPVLLLR